MQQSVKDIKYINFWGILNDFQSRDHEVIIKKISDTNLDVFVYQNKTRNILWGYTLTKRKLLCEFKLVISDENNPTTQVINPGINPFGVDNKIDFIKYQEYAMSGFNANATGTPMDMAYAAMGTSIEIAEAIDHINKFVWHKREIDKHAATLELGDAFWFIAVTMKLLGIKLSDVLASNKAKLDVRYKDGRKDLTFRDTKLEYIKSKEATETSK